MMLPHCRATCPVIKRNGLVDDLPPHDVPALIHFDVFTESANGWSLCTGRVVLVRAACRRLVQREHASDPLERVTCRECIGLVFDMLFSGVKPWWSRD
jgi:hypothetical protein